MATTEENLLDPDIIKEMRLGEKMLAVYKLRFEGNHSWKDIGNGLGIDRTKAERMYARVHEWIHFYGMKEDDLMSMIRVFGKFCEDRDVTRLISLMTMNQIHSLEELNCVNLDRMAMNGIGERYTQVLKNVQTYLRNGAGYNRTIHAVISEYAFELLKKECESTNERMGKVITRALLFYCGIEDQNKKE